VLKVKLQIIQVDLEDIIKNYIQNYQIRKNLIRKQNKEITNITNNVHQ